MRVFGIDPGSQRTGFGCVESDGRRHRLVICGAIRVRTSDAFATRLSAIYRELTIHIRDTQPDVVAIENLFHANNVRSALLLARTAWKSQYVWSCAERCGTQSSTLCRAIRS